MPGPEIHQNNVRPGEQPLYDRPGTVISQLEWQGMLATIAGNEDPALARHDLSHATIRIARRRLDLDDLGAALREHLPAERYCHELTEFDDANAVERL